MFFTRLTSRRVFAAGTLLIAGACGSGGSTDPADNVPTCSNSNPTLVAVQNLQANLLVRSTVQASAEVTWISGCTFTLAWSTSNSSVATVSQSGLITGISPGTALISATAQGTS